MPRKPAGLSEVAVKGINLNGYGSAEVVTIAEINVDPDYQRDLRHDLVNKIAREYDIVKAGPILLSTRSDGSVWCVDGQHRMAGALQAGETEMLANVIHGLSKEDEAELRLARNDRRPDTIYEVFRSRLVMGDKKAHALQEVVRQQGGEINTTGPSTSHGINAIASLEVIFDIDGTGAALGRTLRTIRQAFAEETPPGETKRSVITPDTASANMLKAVTWFLAQHVDAREASLDEYAARLGSIGVDDLRRKAVSHKAANGGSAWLNWYRAMVEAWNYRRQEKNMIRWKTVGSITQLGTTGGQKTAWRSGRNQGGRGSSS